MADWTPSPKQLEFLNAADDEVFFGGSVGPGKSFGLLLFALLRRMTIPNSKGLILRRTFPELEMSLIAKSREIFPGFGAKYQEQHRRWVFPNGSVQFFGFLEREKDVYRYQSAEMEDICFDELSGFTEFQYLYLFSRLRTTKPGVRCLMRSASNPGGLGHSWIKKRFIDVGPPGKPYTDPAAGTTRRFVPATLDDNPYIQREQYERMLENLPEDQRRMLRFGDWDAFTGQAFDEYRRDIHVVEPFAIPAHWRRWIGNDPGYTDPFAFYWFAADEDGNVYVYREYTREPSDEKVTYSDQGAGVMGLSVVGSEIDRPEFDQFGRPVVESIDFVVTGMDAFNRHPETGKSITDYYAEGGIPWGFVKPIHGPNSRRLRKSVVHEYLKTYEDENIKKTVARLRIFNTCRKLIETLPTLVTDPNDAEKVAECGIDHWFDALSYGLGAWHTSHSDSNKVVQISRHQRYKERLIKKKSRSRRMRRSLLC